MRLLKDEKYEGTLATWADNIALNMVELGGYVVITPVHGLTEQEAWALFHLTDYYVANSYIDAYYMAKRK